MKAVVEMEEFKALKKNLEQKEPEETDEERFLKELAELDKIKAKADIERRKEEERLTAEENMSEQFEQKRVISALSFLT